MREPVVLQVAGCPESLAAHITLVVLLARVDASVHHQAVLALEAFATVLAREVSGKGRRNSCQKMYEKKKKAWQMSEKKKH